MITDSNISKGIAAVRDLEDDLLQSVEDAAKVGVHVVFTRFNEATLPPMPAAGSIEHAAWGTVCLAALDAHARTLGHVSKAALRALVRNRVMVRGAGCAGSA